MVANFSSHASLVAALSGHDAVLSCVPGGATDFESQKLLIDAAVAAGVKLFFASEYSANVMTWQYARLPTQFVGDKPRIRRYLEDKSKEGLIAWTALNGGPFFDLCEFPTTCLLVQFTQSHLHASYPRGRGCPPSSGLLTIKRPSKTSDCVLISTSRAHGRSCRFRYWQSQGHNLRYGQ